MEEDIKILEDVLKDKDTKLWIGEQGIQAIENLIARYKELEEENKQYKLLSANIEKANKIIEEYRDMKALLKIQASIAKELDFDTPDKMTKFRNSYYVPVTMEVRADIGKQKRLELSYVDASKFLAD